MRTSRFIFCCIISSSPILLFLIFFRPFTCFLFFVYQGGILFEYYLLGHAQQKDYLLVFTSIGLRVQLSLEDRKRLVNDYGLLFCFDSIRVMHQLNRKCTRPLALWTLLQE